MSTRIHILPLIPTSCRPEMEACGLGHVPMQMVHRLEQATGTRLNPGHNPDVRAMFHLWEPLRCSYM